jgi:hypothetical protein
MFRGKLFILSIIATALLHSQFLPLPTSATSNGIPEPYSLLVSFAEYGSRHWFICPQGDGQTLAKGGCDLNGVHVTIFAPAFNSPLGDSEDDWC